MRSPLRFPSLPASATFSWPAAGSLVTDLLTPTLRLGVTGLARSGKTVFIAALVRNLVAGGRLPFLSAYAEGRITGACLEPQPDDAVPRFDYEAHIAGLEADPPVWPESTKRVSELRVTIAFRPDSALRRLAGVGRIHVDIVDYPGEWLVDLAMLRQDFAAWSGEALRLAREPRRSPAADSFLGFLTALQPGGAADELVAIEGARLFTDYLRSARQNEQASILGPGRFVMPGDLEGSPLLTFFPLDLASDPAPARGSLAALLARRYESYRDKVVRPFFREHFSRLHRQIVLVDVLSSLDQGPDTLADLERGLADVLDVFRPDMRSWFARLTGKHIDRLLIAATKADHLHHTSHERLEAILSLLTRQAIARAAAGGAEPRVMAMAALRATREAEVKEGGEVLPCIVGVPLAGERVGGKVFNGREEAVVFPGDLPHDPALALDRVRAREALLTSFVRFRPPRLGAASASGEVQAAPHIRLDRVLEFLIGDWLA